MNRVEITPLDGWGDLERIDPITLKPLSGLLGKSGCGKAKILGAIHYLLKGKSPRDPSVRIRGTFVPSDTRRDIGGERSTFEPVPPSETTTLVRSPKNPSVSVPKAPGPTVENAETSDLADLLPQPLYIPAGPFARKGRVTASRNQLKQLRNFKNPDLRSHLQNTLRRVSTLLPKRTSPRSKGVGSRLREDLVEAIEPAPRLTWSPDQTPFVRVDDENSWGDSMADGGEMIHRLVLYSLVRSLSEFPPEEPIVMLYEYPESFLHEGLQKKLLRAFDRLTNRGHQVILTTNSPYFSQNPRLDVRLIIHRDQTTLRATELEKPSCFLLPVDYDSWGSADPG